MHRASVAIGFVIKALDSYGGQLAVLLLLFYSTFIPALLHLNETDLMKQAFALFAGFVNGRSSSSSRVKELEAEVATLQAEIAKQKP